jgi:hypothetical protein
MSGGVAGEQRCAAAPYADRDGQDYLTKPQSKARCLKGGLFLAWENLRRWRVLLGLITACF